MHRASKKRPRPAGDDDYEDREMSKEEKKARAAQEKERRKAEAAQEKEKKKLQRCASQSGLTVMMCCCHCMHYYGIPILVRQVASYLLFWGQTQDVSRQCASVSISCFSSVQVIAECSDSQTRAVCSDIAAHSDIDCCLLNLVGYICAVDFVRSRCPVAEVIVVSHLPLTNSA